MRRSSVTFFVVCILYRLLRVFSAGIRDVEVYIYVVVPSSNFKSPYRSVGRFTASQVVVRCEEKRSERRYTDRKLPNGPEDWTNVSQMRTVDNDSNLDES